MNVCIRENNYIIQICLQSGKNRLEEHEVKIQKLEQHRLSKTVVVPTAERDVIHFLRLLKEPKTLFGEGKVRWCVLWNVGSSR